MIVVSIEGIILAAPGRLVALIAELPSAWVVVGIPFSMG